MSLLLLIIAFFLLAATLCCEWLSVTEGEYSLKRPSPSEVWRGWIATGIFFMAAGMWWK